MENSLVQLPRKIESGKFAGIPYISASQLKELLTCSARYKFKYIDGLKEKDSTESIFGTASHSAIEQATRISIGKREIISGDSIGKIAQDEFIKKTKDLTDRERVELEIEEIEKFVPYIWNSLQEEKFNPINSEMQLIQLFDNKTWATMGYSDLLGYDKDGILSVVDLKTTKRSPPKALNRVHSLQCLLYVNALRAMGHPVERAYLMYAVRNKTPKIVWVQVPITENGLKWAISMTKNAKGIIERGEFYPNPIGASYLCNPKYCSFWDICEASPKWDTSME